jgi:hypothetical protein
MQTFVPTSVTANRGTIRVREIVTWDAGAFPLPFDGSAGVAIQVPAEVKFVGSNVHGHMASECVIDVESANRVMIGGTLVTLRKGERHGGNRGDHSLRVPPRTVEILITNFPPQRAKALPWSAHFRWLFEAAGYRPVVLSNDDLKPFIDRAGEYDPDALKADMPLLVGSAGSFPFPFIEMVAPDFKLNPVNHVHVGNDPWNRPVCPQGDG